jgi:hypothetical protein
MRELIHRGLLKLEWILPSRRGLQLGELTQVDSDSGHGLTGARCPGGA